jgi:hypothetical protein
MTQRGRQPIAARDTEQPNVTSSLASLVVWPSLLGLTTHEAHEGTHQPYWPCGHKGLAGFGLVRRWSNLACQLVLRWLGPVRMEAAQRDLRLRGQFP